MTSAQETDLAHRLMKGIAAVLGVALVVALVACFTASPTSFSPPAWLVDWTSWLVSALSAIFAPLVLVSAAQALRKFSQ